MNKSNFPKIDLTTFFLSISSAAYMGLGAGKTDLNMARQNIDLLELLKEKTKGNRTADEDRLLDELLMELRIRFLEAEKSLKSKT